MKLNKVITTRLVDNILSTDSFIKQEIINAIAQNTNNLDLLIKMCEIITNRITIWEQHMYNNITETKYILYRGKRKKDTTEEEEKALMVYGTQLIYILRSFIVGTNIDFLFGASNKEGDTVSAIIEQDTVLKHLVATKKNAIGLTNRLQTQLIAAASVQENEMVRTNRWKIIESLATVENYTDHYKYVRDKSNKAHRAYQNEKRDMQVYVAFFGKTKRHQLYYNTEQYGLQLFNKGWLWEWYNDFYYNASDAEYIAFEAALEKQSIAPIIGALDQIRGTKQGDFLIHGREIQAKYNNIKIISYNNIREIIHQLYKLLLLIKSNTNPQQAQTMMQELLNQHFIPETARVGQKTVEYYAEKLIKNLNLSK